MTWVHDTWHEYMTLDLSTCMTHYMSTWNLTWVHDAWHKLQLVMNSLAISQLSWWIWPSTESTAFMNNLPLCICINCTVLNSYFYGENSVGLCHRYVISDISVIICDRKNHLPASQWMRPVVQNNEAELGICFNDIWEKLPEKVLHVCCSVSHVSQANHSYLFRKNTDLFYCVVQYPTCPWMPHNYIHTHEYNQEAGLYLGFWNWGCRQMFLAGGVDQWYFYTPL